MDQAVNENFIGSLPGARPPVVDAGPWSVVPPEAPLAMPAQDFSTPPKVVAPANAKPLRRGYWVPRAAVFAGATMVTAAFAHELFSILAFARMTPLQFTFLVLSTISFAWITLGSLSAALGFLPLFAGERPDTLKRRDPTLPLRTKTALLFPVYHEDPSRIAGTIDAMARDLAALGKADAFEIFVLSDTREKAAIDDANREAAVYRALSADLGSIMPVYYRRRLKNHARKAGNIADWVERFGAAYEHFIILDADSVMSGEAMVSLALTMQHEPNAGLIQSVPRLVGGTSLLQHLQQFASNTYGPSVAAGIASWHRDQGNYWGHNAIIRTKAFADTAGLPELPGRKPFGGHILSHDFVEAVCLQRAGWGVHMLPTLQGSYEGMPPNIVDCVVRDRRWAQGNLQHLALVSEYAITPMGRVHMAMGAIAYLISAVWAASLIVGVVLALQGNQMIPSYFQDRQTLFPIWPIIDPGAALRLFLATMAVVLLPKGLGLILEWKEARRMRSFAHSARSTLGVMIETIFSMLIAPILMLTQTVGSIQILLGFDSGWAPQQRNDGRLSFVDAMWFARWHTLIGSVTGIIVWSVSGGLLAWMAPVIAGLVLTGPVSWYTSRPAPAVMRWALATAEDRKVPSILEAANTRADVWAERMPSLLTNTRAVAEAAE